MKHVEVEFTFKGWVAVDDGEEMTLKEAKKIVSESFGVVIDTPHSSDDRIVDWDISTHPDKVKYICRK